MYYTCTPNQAKCAYSFYKPLVDTAMIVSLPIDENMIFKICIFKWAHVAIDDLLPQLTMITGVNKEA